MAQKGKANDPSRGQGGSAAGHTVVSYSDSAGVVWRAYERIRPGSTPVLVFESVNAIRVVRDYPPDWHTLPRAALEALSWGV